jgi:hypothetical protein
MDAGKIARIRQTSGDTGQKPGDPLTIPKGAHAAEVKPTSKLGLIVRLLEREGGVSLAELVAATGWQPHSVRGALAGTLRRKGHAVLSEKTAGARRYRIEASQ